MEKRLTLPYFRPIWSEVRGDSAIRASVFKNLFGSFLPRRCGEVEFREIPVLIYRNEKKMEFRPPQAGKFREIQKNSTPQQRFYMVPTRVCSKVKESFVIIIDS